MQFAMEAQRPHTRSGLTTELTPPKLSSKLRVLIGQALREFVEADSSELQDFVEAYSLPPLEYQATGGGRGSRRAYASEYFGRVVIDVLTDHDKDRSAVCILSAMLTDARSQSPVLEQENWVDANTHRPTWPPALHKCVHQMEAEKIRIDEIFDFAKSDKANRGDRAAEHPRGEGLEARPELTRATPPGSEQWAKELSEMRIFVIHGHDEAKWRELVSLLKEKILVEPVVMQEQPGMSRTFIEKFEELAAPCDGAIAILTPDDAVVQGGKEQYAQPRPNVIFELGWFVGKRGRNRTLLLVKKGTSVPSDWYGIEQLQFKDKVEETYVKLEREIKAWSKPFARSGGTI